MNVMPIQFGSPSAYPVLTGAINPLLKRIFCVALLIFSAISVSARQFTVSTTYIDDGFTPEHQYQHLTASNHRQYAEMHGAKFHLVADNLLVGQCENPLTRRGDDCSPYWNKVAMIMNWVNEPEIPGEEEYLIYGDDDGIYANMEISPSELVDQLYKEVGGTPPILIVNDVHDWSSRRVLDPGLISINTGFMIIRKCMRSRQFLSLWWDERNYQSGYMQRRIREKTPDIDCLTLGMCKTDETFDDQEGFARAMTGIPMQWGHVIGIVNIRSGDRLWGVNTVDIDGCYKAVGSKKNALRVVSRKNTDGGARKGDFFIQTPGVPRMGRNCGDPYDMPPHPLRRERIEHILETLVANQTDCSQSEL